MCAWFRFSIQRVKEGEKEEGGREGGSEGERVADILSFSPLSSVLTHQFHECA